MKLKQLFKGLDFEIRGSKDVEIQSLCTDSRIASPGSCFLAKKGHIQNGNDFIEQAVRTGSAAVVTSLYNPFLKVSQVICPHPEEIEALLAARFYEHPSNDLFVAGITGTKGKSTTAYLVQHLIPHCGLIGTVETIAGGERRSSSFTTPFPIEIQKLLAEMRNKQDVAAAMEVSSHGLTQNRVEEVSFDAAIFTNLAPDHLDFHLSLEEYAKAKKELFLRLDQSKKKRKIAIFNGDHPWTEFMAKDIQTPKWFFGFNEGNDLRATDLAFDSTGSRFLLHFEGKKTEIQIPLLGKFNVYNALGAIAIALFKGENIETISAFSQVPGRLERIKNERGIWAFVDYAHTGESLQNVIDTLKEFVTGRVILVFGAGGDRDKARRFDMGKVAYKSADFSIITSDNPRSEDPKVICEEIDSMFLTKNRRVICVDRLDAIKMAVSMAKEGDAVLVAGKGHEKVQIIGRQTSAFDDVEILQDALENLNMIASSMLNRQKKW